MLDRHKLISRKYILYNKKFITITTKLRFSTEVIGNKTVDTTIALEGY